MAARVLDLVPGEDPEQRREERAEQARPHAAPPARVLGIRLREMRLEAGLRGQDVVAAGAIGSTSKLSRYETANGAARPDAATVARLAALYGYADPESLRALTSLVDDANQHRWWTDYRDVVDTSLNNLMAVESAAKEIRTFSDSLVPGLLQTSDYARAIMQAPYLGKPDHATIDRRWEVRRRRQQLLESPEAPDYSAVVSEGALRKWVGGRKVMRGQLRQLFNLAENRDSVHIRIFTDRACEQVCPLTSAMTVFKFPATGEPDMIYREGLNSGGTWLSEPADVDLHAASMTELFQHSLGKRETLALLEHLIAGFADDAEPDRN
ncbi:helix-turn-helix domain-containing protein [Streptomyces sp. NPDC048111]|uniref:helix-turn-helix domain-containing protein n=1 Tax=Streptomyces sp. NPDC048111 TaxID=3365500 RepID=UPI00371908F1